MVAGGEARLGERNHRLAENACKFPQGCVLEGRLKRAGWQNVARGFRVLHASRRDATLRAGFSRSWSGGCAHRGSLHHWLISGEPPARSWTRILQRVAVVLFGVVVTMSAIGCSYSHPGGGEFGDNYMLGGPERAFLMHIAWNRKLCADPGRVVLLGDGIRSHSLKWREGLTMGELIEPAQWRHSMSKDSVVSAMDFRRLFKFGIIGVWRNDEGKFERFPRLGIDGDEITNVRLNHGDIVIWLERRVSF